MFWMSRSQNMPSGCSGLMKGDTVILIDGAGGWYEARIQDDHPKACLLSIISHVENYKPLPYQLHIAISPTKNMDRFEWFLEKATEIGISQDYAPDL